MRSSERGAILIHVALAIVVVFAFSAWIMDGGVMWNARAQAQNAADAGALAGAVSRAFDEFADPPSAGGKTVTSINATVAANQVWNAAVTPAISWTCPASAFGGTAGTRCVRVDVTRTGIPAYAATVFGVASQQVRATATAQVVDANATDCLKPWMIPDKWRENNGNQTFDPGIDVYIAPSAGPAAMTGYQPRTSVGLQATLHTGNPSAAISPSDYYDIDVGSGGSGLRNAIANCSGVVVSIGQILTTQPGQTTGPNTQGANDLINKDLSASWSTSCQCVTGSNAPVSPRIVPMAVFSPVEFTNLDRSSGRIQLTIVNILAFFVEAAPPGGDIVGRFVNEAGILRPGGTGNPSGTSFLSMISLVR
jgi:Flp pilus assembly protein TadG